MGFWGDLWEGIKRPFRWAYDSVIQPAWRGLNTVYDKVKGWLPAPVRAITDQIQSTGNLVESGVKTARDAMTSVGLKDGGMVEMPKKKFQA